MAKILAARPEKLLPQIIFTDQTGFILNRHSSSNLRRLLNIVYSPAASVPKMLISLDAKKEFDRVKWNYLLSITQKTPFFPAPKENHAMVSHSPKDEFLLLNHQYGQNKKQKILYHRSYLTKANKEMTEN